MSLVGFWKYGGLMLNTIDPGTFQVMIGVVYGVLMSLAWLVGVLVAV